MAMTSRPGTRAAEPQAPQRSALNRERVLDAAIAYMDEHGVQHLTMRRLGESLEVEAMALYRYVNGREDLLEGVVDRLVGTLVTDPEEAPLEPTDGWQAYLQWLAHAVRGLAGAHPSIFPLIATRHPAAPWLRPPLRSLEVVEHFLEALLARGFSEAQAARTYRVFTSFLLGHLLLEAASSGASTAPVEEPLDEGDADLPTEDEQLDLSDYPTVMALRRMLSEDKADAEFEQALEALLDRLDLEFSQ
jgi:TetR/AcrR family transcriptional regulator, tetracycline repressor protein